DSTTENTEDTEGGRALQAPFRVFRGSLSFLRLRRAENLSASRHAPSGAVGFEPRMNTNEHECAASWRIRVARSRAPIRVHSCSFVVPKKAALTRPLLGKGLARRGVQFAGQFERVGVAWRLVGVEEGAPIVVRQVRQRAVDQEGAEERDR